MGKITTEELQSLRRDYAGRPFRRADLPSEPLVLFRSWFDEAVAAGAPQANAMVLATVSSGSLPSARVVLLKSVDERGFSFYTNFESQKARELDESGVAALVFYWHEVHRQVRLAGRVVRVPDDEARAYFASRPRGAQVGAWASPQSASLPTREELEQRVAAMEERFAGNEIEKPEHWGGYRLVPHTFEFWQGRESRLHDRMLYTRAGRSWSIRRLAP